MLCPSPRAQYKHVEIRFLKYSLLLYQHKDNSRAAKGRQIEKIFSTRLFLCYKIKRKLARATSLRDFPSLYQATLHSLLVLSPSTNNKKYTAIQASLMLCILVVLLFSLSHLNRYIIVLFPI